MSQDSATKINFLIKDKSIPLSKLRIDDYTVQVGFNTDMVDSCRVSTIAPLGSEVSNLHIMTSKALRDFVFPIGCQYRQYPIMATNVTLDAFPDELAPAFLFGGSWEKLWYDEGSFFRTEKTGETGRLSSGVQPNTTALNGLTAYVAYEGGHSHSLSAHYHYVCANTRSGAGTFPWYAIAHSTVNSFSGNTEYNLDSVSGGSANCGTSSYSSNATTGNSTAHYHTLSGTDTETRPDNRLFIIWRRKA